MNDYAQAEPGRAYAMDFGLFHSDAGCTVVVFVVGTNLWLSCATCHVAVQAEPIAVKITPESACSVRGLTNDPSQS